MNKIIEEILCCLTFLFMIFGTLYIYKTWFDRPQEKKYVDCNFVLNQERQFKVMAVNNLMQNSEIFISDEFKKHLEFCRNKPNYVGEFIENFPVYKNSINLNF